LQLQRQILGVSGKRWLAAACWMTCYGDIGAVLKTPFGPGGAR
jgi:hypothetical protein